MLSPHPVRLEKPTGRSMALPPVIHAVVSAGSADASRAIPSPSPPARSLSFIVIRI
jgi:hypothetical protein